MGLFDGMFNKKKKSQEPQGVPLEQNDRPEEKDKGSFIGFVLLDSPRWDREAILDTLSRKWGIRPDPGDEEDASEPNIAVIKVNGAMVALSLMPGKVPDGEAERYAAANYFWKEAVEEILADPEFPQVTELVIGSWGSAWEDDCQPS